jgi:hypothetical protein
VSSLTGGNEWSTECKFLPALPRPPPGWELLRHSQRKRGATDRLDLQNTAPVLDPTGMAPGFRKRWRDSRPRVRRAVRPGSAFSGRWSARSCHACGRVRQFHTGLRLLLNSSDMLFSASALPYRIAPSFGRRTLTSAGLKNGRLVKFIQEQRKGPIGACLGTEHTSFYGRSPLAEGRGQHTIIVWTTNSFTLTCCSAGFRQRCISFCGWRTPLLPELSAMVFQKAFAGLSPHR